MIPVFLPCFDQLIAEDAPLNFDPSHHVVAHLAARNGCAKTLTFDEKIAKRIPGMEFLT
ncbi:hypothetical protein PY650_26105 [Rhizobium calliandrae]|uniref:PIN domain-containing protein n=1 Tax=Rhizobium calliandrae TaxID=1312182 RepID=A0ABT7KK88_9HYPH|nr:hypothetical protein [Rhizobium calliandrae]MDL2409047.1 hypothetical protein [Rhizobium calliandrae]